MSSEKSETGKTTLDAINEALSGIDDNVIYGTARTLPKDAPWDYTVFGRRRTKLNTGLTSKGCEYDVAVVRENFVPEGMEEKVIGAMRAIPGMAPVTGQSVQYYYDRKPGTNVTVEMMVVTFAKSSKMAPGK